MRSYPSRCWPFLFTLFLSVLLPTGELQNHTSSFCGWNFVDTSLGHWNRAYRLGFRCLRKLSRVFTGQRRNLRHFTIGFVRVTKTWSTKCLHVCFTRSINGLLVFPYYLKYFTLQGLQDLLIVYHFTNSPHWMMTINFSFNLSLIPDLLADL